MRLVPPILFDKNCACGEKKSKCKGDASFVVAEIVGFV